MTRIAPDDQGSSGTTTRRRAGRRHLEAGQGHRRPRQACRRQGPDPGGGLRPGGV